jgi:predicted ATPase
VFEQFKNINKIIYDREDVLYYFFSDSEKRSEILDRDGGKRSLNEATINPFESILVQIKDPEKYPELSHIAESYKKFAFYRNWHFGPEAPIRKPQEINKPTNQLLPDFSNLAIFLRRIGENQEAKTKLLKYLSYLYEGFKDFEVVSVGGNYVQINFIEQNDIRIPSERLSDGTLRYLAICAILCDPTPPPVICMEEPELGLHPDIIPKIAALLKDASERTQIITTTHSDILIDALSDTPESVVVCEKVDGSTVMKRLDKENLSGFLERYRLGELWLSGEIGGTRW